MEAAEDWNSWDYNSVNSTLGEGVRNYFVQIFGPVFVVQWIFWLISFALRTEKLYDLVGAATYLCVTIVWGFRLAPLHGLGQILQAVWIAIWCLRLGGFLFYRVLKTGSDRRFDEIKKSLWKYFLAWTAQGLWITINTLPSCLMWWFPGFGPSFQWRHGVGAAIFLVFWAIEVVADLQKLAFKADPANAGKFIRSGLWNYSRHPNYFGEIVLWFGLWLSASANFPDGFCYFSLFCPFWGLCLITFISGVPLLEASAEKRWGSRADYREYCESTAALIPFVACWDPLCVRSPSPASTPLKDESTKPPDYDSTAEC